VRYLVCSVSFGDSKLFLMTLLLISDIMLLEVGTSGDSVRLLVLLIGRLSEVPTFYIYLIKKANTLC